MLQSRLFSYPDTHRHRLGTNYQQLPVNLPLTEYPMGNFQRDGPMAFMNQGSRSNYLATIDPIQYKDRKVNVDKVHAKFVSNAIVFLSTLRPEDFNAPRALWEKVYNDEQRKRLIKNMSEHMATVTDKSIIERQIGIFRAVSEDLASGLEKATGVKGLSTLKGVTFNGSHNGMDTSNVAPANGLPVSLSSVMAESQVPSVLANSRQRKEEICFENGGPGEQARPTYK